MLQRVLNETKADEVFAAGFGPGLTIEFARLYKLAASPASATDALSSGSAPKSAKARDAVRRVHWDDDAIGGEYEEESSSVRSEASA